MKCVVCKQAETRPGVTTVTFERGGSTFVVREVPAQVCPNCGEDYVDSKVTAELLRSTEELSRTGAQVDIRRYAAAA
jgi:YgiT-type zinc finger domain-containing protein